MAPSSLPGNPKTTWSGALGMLGTALVAVGGLVPGKTGHTILVIGAALAGLGNSLGNFLAKDAR